MLKFLLEHELMYLVKTEYIDLISDDMLQAIKTTVKLRAAIFQVTTVIFILMLRHEAVLF